MEFHFVHEQVDRNPVIQRDSYDRRRCEHLDVFFLDWDVQILGFFEDGVADLFFGVAIHYPKPGLFLHLVGKLVFINVWRKKLESREDAKDENCGEDNRF